MEAHTERKGPGMNDAATSSELPYEKALGLAAKVIALIIRLLSPDEIQRALDDRGLRDEIVKLWQGKTWTPELLLVRAACADMNLTPLKAAELLGRTGGLYELCKGLSPTSMVILGMRYGLDVTKPERCSHSEIAHEVKHHQDRVRDMERTALMLLRDKLTSVMEA